MRHGRVGGLRKWRTTSKQSAEITLEFLEAFADAWNRHDVDGLLSFMTEDRVFEASAEDEVCGTRYEGFEEVRAGFAKAWESLPDARWSNASHFICGERGVSEWVFSGTRFLAVAALKPQFKR